jgi:hypothetical protein
MKRPEDLRDYLQEWLDGHRRASEIASYVKRSLDHVGWQCDVLRDAPETVRRELESGLGEMYDQHYKEVSQVLPRMPNFPPRSGSEIVTITASGVAGITDFISRIDPPSYPGYDRHVELYLRIQENEGRAAEVRGLIERLFPQLTQRFDDAESRYDAARIGTAAEIDAATEMRTLLDKAKGELFDKARCRPGENMTWEEMANRLYPPPPSPVRNAAIRAHEFRPTVYDALSRLLKDQRPPLDLGQARALALDHLLPILRAVEAGGEK